MCHVISPVTPPASTCIDIYSVLHLNVLFLHTNFVTPLTPPCLLPFSPFHSMPYKGPIDCALQTLRNEGPLKFYTGFPTYLVR
jgi:hypothetical protein